MAKLLSCNLEGVVDCVVDSLNWMELLTFEMLSGLPLRSKLQKKRLVKIFMGWPMPLNESLQLDWAFLASSSPYQVWNDQMLTRRHVSARFFPLCRSDLYVAKFYEPFPCSNDMCKINDLKFNPNFSCLAVTYSSLTTANRLAVLWFDGVNKDQRQAHYQGAILGESSKQLSFQWSTEGTYLSFQVEDSHQASLSFFKVVDPNLRTLTKLKGLEFKTRAGRTTENIWISDSSFLLPGYNDFLRPVRPWCYTILEGGKRLVVRQPLRKLRKEFKRQPRYSKRGLLVALDRGYSLESTFCPGNVREEKNFLNPKQPHAFLHSIVHFYDPHQNSISDLSLPGIFMSAAGYEDKAYLVYRENLNCQWTSGPVFTCPQSPANELNAEKLRNRLTERTNFVVRFPLGNLKNINKAECVSDSSTASELSEPSDSETDEDCKESISKGCSNRQPRETKKKRRRTETKSNCPSLKVGSRSWHHKYLARKKFDGNQTARVWRNTTTCSLGKADPVQRGCGRKSRLSFYEVDLKSMELRKIDLENDEQSKLLTCWMSGKFAAESLDEHEQLCRANPFREMNSKSGCLRATANHLIFNNPYPWGSIPRSYQFLRRHQLEKGSARISAEVQWWHPTKNLYASAGWPNNIQAPFVVRGSPFLCPDYLLRYDNDQGEKKEGFRPSALQSVTYVLTDSNGEVVVDQNELRSKPAYLNSFL